MDEFTTFYEFEEVRVPGYDDGILLYGIAELSSEREPGEFYVRAVKIGDRWLESKHNGFDGHLFRAVCKHIYSSDDATSFYSEEFSGFSKPSFDHVYDAKRERAMA